MSLLECKRNAELKQSLAAGHWPEAASQELREHVKACRSCGDVAAISMVLRTAKVQALPERPMLSPSLIWWRAQLRQRQAKMEKLSRPLVRTQVVVLLLALCVCGAVAREAMRRMSVSGEFHQLSAIVAVFVTALGPVTFAICLAMLVLMGGALAYTMVERE